MFFCSFAGALSCFGAEPDDVIAQQPLAPRSGPQRGTLFVPLAPDETGIATENRFADPQIWWERYPEFTTGAVGTGVAIGDYDGDGRPDLFVVSKTETSRLFRNLGGWRFEDTTETSGLATARGLWAAGRAWLQGLMGDDSRSASDAGAAWSSGATFADVDNDGALDLYVCRIGGPNLLYVNQGDGTFREEAEARGLAVNDGSAMAAFADFDRDGWLDVYVLTNLLDYIDRPQGQPDLLFRNRGDGTFLDVTASAGISGEAQGHSATWWDHNHDGWPDLYVANDFSPADRLYQNNGDGTFTDVIDRVAPHTPFSAMGADLGDVDNDGQIDLLVADMAATTAEKDLRGMADSRAWTHQDAIGAAPQYARNTLLLNTGTGVCREAALLSGLAATDWTWSVRFEDLDNDGWLDLHVTNGMVREMNNVDLLAKLTTALTARERVKIMRNSPVLAQPNLAYRNTGDLHFEDVSSAWGLDQLGVSFGAAFGDLDGDGDLDLVFSNFEAGVTVLRNDSDSGHRVTVGFRGTTSNRHGVGATVRVETEHGIQTRQLVLARGYASSSEPRVHFGLGDAAHIRRLTVEWPSGRTQSFEDLPADRHFTISESAGATPGTARSSPPERARFAEVGREIGFALQPRREVAEEQPAQKLVPFRHHHQGPAIAVGDLDGDARDDIVIGGTTQDPPVALLQSPAGIFASRPIEAWATRPAVNDGPLLILDVNGDGANDLIVSKGPTMRLTHEAALQPQLLLNRGAGNLAPAGPGHFPALQVCAGALVAADFDRDGDLDLFLGGRVEPGRYPAPPPSVLLRNESGRFEDVTASFAPGLDRVGMVTSALWTDVDDDGWIDLLLALEWGGIRFWRNTGGDGFADASDAAGFSAAGTGWWSALAAADFNGDGRPDYVAGNVGLNTQYRASPAEPALLFAGDFGGAGGAPQLLEARWDGGRLVPWRTLKDLRAAIPAMGRSVSSNDAFARATLAELVGERRLATAKRLAATEFRSGVFLSGVDGTFRFAPLPRIAQIAPAQGIVTGDFDGDGHADICVLQNSHAPIPAIGRFDGGVSQVLLGDGRGGFAAAAPVETGLVVPGDGEALATIDLGRDGWPDLLATHYRGPTLAFRHGSVPGRQALRVVLRGPPGNPTAAGSRLTLEFADGTTQTTELYLGGGYMSQSAAGSSFAFAANHPPRRLHVRWPSAQITTHPLSATSAELVISAP